MSYRAPPTVSSLGRLPVVTDACVSIVLTLIRIAARILSLSIWSVTLFVFVYLQNRHFSGNEKRNGLMTVYIHFCWGKHGGGNVTLR